MQDELDLFEYIERYNVAGLNAALVKIKQNYIDEGNDPLELPPAFYAKNNHGNSLLECALQKDYLDIFRELLSAGVPFMVYDENEKKRKPILNSAGETIMHTAVKLRGDGFVHALLDHDFSLNAVDRDGKTAVEVANGAADKTNGVGEINIAALLRIHAQWQNKANFGFNQVLRALQKLSAKIKSDRPTNKLFLIGRTGAGKSTLLNYLNGAKYELRLEPSSGKRYAELVARHEKAVAKVGEGMVSQTLLPQIVMPEHLSYVYCDLAGLFDTRSEEERITAAMSLHFLSKLPGQIKGLLVVLDFNSLGLAGKGEGLKSVAIALAKMIKNNPAILDSLHFCVTHVPKENLGKITPEGILQGYIGPLLNYYKKQASQRVLSEEETNIRFVLELLVSGGVNKITIPNITDEGETKVMLEGVLNRLVSHHPNDYDFMSHDAAQKKFTDMLKTIAQTYIDLKHKKENFIHLLMDTQENNNRNRAILEECHHHLYVLEERLHQPLRIEHLFEVLAQLERERNHMFRRKDELCHQLNDIQQEIARKEAQCKFGEQFVFPIGCFSPGRIKMPSLHLALEAQKDKNVCAGIIEEINKLERFQSDLQQRIDNLQLSIVQAQADDEVMRQQNIIERQACREKIQRVEDEMIHHQFYVTQLNKELDEFTAEFETNYPTFKAVYEFARAIEFTEGPIGEFSQYFFRRDEDAVAHLLYRDIFEPSRHAYTSPVRTNEQFEHERGGMAPEW